MIQELISDKNNEYTCTVVKVKHRISEVIIFKRILRSGDTYKAQPIRSNTISDYVSKVANKLNFDGPCNFQLRVDYNNIPKIFEINCRFSGTTPFCSQIGFNPVEYYLKKTLKKEYNYKIKYSVYILRYWSEVLIKNDTLKNIEKEKSIETDFKLKINLFDKINEKS